jgi:hypothetical protein
MYGRKSHSSTNTDILVGLSDNIIFNGGLSNLLSNCCVKCLQALSLDAGSGDKYLSTHNLLHTRNIGAVASLQDLVRVASSFDAMKSFVDSFLSEWPAINNMIEVASDNVMKNNAVNQIRFWNDANTTLLLPYKPITTLSKNELNKKSNSNDDNYIHSIDLLWSRVFRKPFLHQVESALHASSVLGLLRMQQRLFRSLYLVGVIVVVSIIIFTKFDNLFLHDTIEFYS